MKNIIYKIQRFSLHDGRGIRTIIFLKGCHLTCPWCSNPESQSFKVECVKDENICMECSECLKDPTECPTNAIRTIGEEMTVSEVVEEVLKDYQFYKRSEGGVTISGGEPLDNIEYVIQLTEAFYELGISVIVETSGDANISKLIKEKEKIESVYFDLKIMNQDKANEILNCDIRRVKNNLVLLVDEGFNVIPRMPLIPRYTIDDRNIEDIMGLLKTLNLKEVHLLPYHNYGEKKYQLLDRKYLLKNIKLSKIDLESIKNKFLKEGFDIKIGG